MFSYLREPTPRGVGDVGVAFTDRRGGVSVGGFRSLNFGRTDVDELAALQAVTLREAESFLRRTVTPARAAISIVCPGK